MCQKKSKADRRKEKQILKTKKEYEKNVRFANKVIPPQKSIRRSGSPEFSKNPRIPFPNFNYKDNYFSWCVEYADLEGSWSWGESRLWNENEYNVEIKGHFDYLLSNTWNDIENFKYNGSNNHQKLLNKYQPVDSICKEAQDRWLANPELAQFEELFRFRRGTHKRIWGVRILDHFFTIWYERNHNICPIDNS